MHNKKKSGKLADAAKKKPLGQDSGKPYVGYWGG